MINSKTKVIPHFTKQQYNNTLVKIKPLSLHFSMYIPTKQKLFLHMLCINTAQQDQTDSENIRGPNVSISKHMNWCSDSVSALKPQ